MIRLFAAAALGLVLATAPALSQSQGGPIPDIDVLVERLPGGNAVVVGQTGRDGWVRGRVRVNGDEYEASAACPPRRTCPAFRLAFVSVDGRAIMPNARGQFVFPVGAGIGQIRLEASVLGQPTRTPQ